MESGKTPRIIKVYKFLIGIAESADRLIFPWIDKLPTGSNRKYPKAIREFDEFIYDIIEKKRNSVDDDHDDFLTSMLKQGADIKQLRDEMVNLFVAGHDSKFESIHLFKVFTVKYNNFRSYLNISYLNGIKYFAILSCKIPSKYM